MRAIELTGKAWSYFLAALERPHQLPQSIMAVSRGVNPGHYFKLNWPWIREAGIQTVLDVGAHKGEFSSAVRVLLPHVHIYAFEPLQDCYSMLSKKMSKNGAFRAFPVALGSKAERMTMWRSSYAKSSSILTMAQLHKDVFPESGVESPMSVEVQTLDDYAAQIALNPKVLLKIDVQGYEAEVLLGATEVLKQVEYVLLEVSFRPLYHGQASFAVIHTLLGSAGFSYSGNLDQLLSPVDGSILQADALFVRTLDAAR